MPGPLTAAQLAFFQTVVQITLDLTANTTRNTGTGVDQYGNPAENWTPVLTGVACSVAEPRSSTLQFYSQGFIGAERNPKISFPVGSDVKRNDRATVNGRTYRIEVDIGRDSFSLLGQFEAVQINEVFN